MKKEENKSTKENPKKRISRTMRFAMANKGLIYEVTDPELRSQLCFYRNKEKKVELMVE